MASSPCMQSLPDTKVGTFYPGAIQRGKKTVASLFCMGQAWKIATIRVANLTHPRKVASSAQNIGRTALYRADCLIRTRCTCLSEVDQAGLGCVMLHLKLRGRAAGLFGACIIASFSAMNDAMADEGGVSFWLPGFFGSLAAAPMQPGWS